MWGLMFEDINQSGDGGLHGQLIRNNGFQGPDPDLSAYGSLNGTSLAMDDTVPLTDAIPRTLRIDVEAGAAGEAGFINSGYWGVPVDGSTYSHSIYVRGEYSGDMTFSLIGNSSGTVFGQSTFHVDSVSDSYTLFEATATTTETSETDISYHLTFDAGLVSGSSLWFALPQLYPTTWNNRENGLKPWIAETLVNIQGTFLRFPGGNNLEGPNVENRWKWNETIGPLENRPGHRGTWGYTNTDALGLHEYLYWCEDMGLEPVLAIYAGYSLDGTAITGDALQPYVQEVLNELEYVLGDTSTTYGALRASNGQTDPWDVKYVEIGNEDYFACDTYPERLAVFHDAISRAYPDLQLIASTENATCLPDPIPEGIILDLHNYNSPDGFVDLFGFFDNIDRSHLYMVGEYARVNIDWPDMQGSVGEAVYMMGMERNSDLIRFAAYAPLLRLVDNQQWRPDLISYHQAPDAIYLSTSYYVQQLFAQNAGDTTHAVTSDTAFGPLYWSATSSGDTYIVKLANYGQDVQNVTIEIAGKTTATLSILANDDPSAANSDTASPVSAPVVSTVTATDGVFSFSAPAWAVIVLAAE
ncbi:Alpha-N-arabinofuranosidase A [Lasiodiplodia theobromae]|uniref:non-reducing end alpha-L-arabinofuranosidase n=1 Tax=Lasiodiplodia theobromae TaxID=45133 RepID=A0A5N5DDL7_9PEZI|nr:Alpha-N-arabinofuranosidase A [Lasiodiplodia theobromae]KAB2575242.1 putative alpha-L-arabinofuranosidase A [Lasiodiplodia theobromae]KAF4542013.1 Alpha-N-arabinofuranosidase A [Lasiodiplodia theobromae]